MRSTLRRPLIGLPFPPYAQSVESDWEWHLGSLRDRMDRRLYPEYGDNWDDEMFRKAVLEVLERNDDLLDLGAGAGLVSQMDFRGVVGNVTGIDPDERVLANPFVDHALIGVGEDIPCADESFDVVISDNVFEHLTKPHAVLGEVHRVLRPGGVLLVKTPNRRHYVSMFARLTPLGFHRRFNALRGRQAQDTYPTQYRINTIRAFRSYASLAGFGIKEVRMVEGRPEYLRINVLLYGVGWLYERIVNASDKFAGFRAVMIVRLVKPIIDSGDYGAPTAKKGHESPGE